MQTFAQQQNLNRVI